jgi:putative hydrolase of the HAD superfamily
MESRDHGVVVFDMDDTLVDRERVFVAAQLRMLKTLRSLGAKRIRVPSSISTLREIELALIRLHKGAHIYDYKELAQALWLYFTDKMNLKQAAERAYYENKVRGIRFEPAVIAARLHDQILFNKIPPLLDSARKVVKKLRRIYLLILFTSGSKDFQKKIIQFYRFDEDFDAVIIVNAKNAAAFRKLRKNAIDLSKRKAGKPPARLVMVGDRISQDILPARDAGFETVWVPGPYYPGKRDQGEPSHTIRKLEDVLGVLNTQVTKSTR